MSANSGAILSARVALVVAMWWAFNWYTSPTNWWGKLYEIVESRTVSKYFDENEPSLFFWGLPPLVIALLAILYFALPRVHFSHLKISRTLYSAWGTTLVFPKPFGIVKLGEVTGLLLVSILAIYYVAKYLDDAYARFEIRYQTGIYTKTQLWQKKVDYFGLVMGVAAIITIGLLFYPVSRRSPILRIMEIPYELAIKYHVWLGHFTNVLTTIHSIVYFVLWTIKKELWVENRFTHLLSHTNFYSDSNKLWQKYGINNLSGFIAFSLSIIMWIAAIKPIRRRFFEAFFYTHQLYILYLLFYVFHVGGWAIFYALSALVLFFLDRLLRLFQSRYPVDIVSSSILLNGYLQINLPTERGLTVDSLSIFFLNVPSISLLQWHPFSVSSRSIDSPSHISIIIKPQNDEKSWTNKLFQCVSSGNLSAAYVEGPYNSELNYFNRYDSLILVAGGAGITPLMSIIQEVIHLHSTQSRAPKSIELIWVMREASELGLLFQIPSSSYPSLTINVKSYVTSEDKEVTRKEVSPLEFKLKDESATLRGVMPPIGSNNAFVEFFIYLLTFLGVIFTLALFSRFIVFPVKKFPSWINGAGFYISLLLGVFVFGTLASLIPSIFVSKSRKVKMSDVAISVHKQEEAFKGEANLHSNANVQYGSRPEWNDLFSSISETMASGTNVGVMACGPKGMMRSIAWECQKRSIFTSSPLRFNFHGLSFDF